MRITTGLERSIAKEHNHEAREIHNMEVYPECLRDPQFGSISKGLERSKILESNHDIGEIHSMRVLPDELRDP